MGVISRDFGCVESDSGMTKTPASAGVFCGAGDENRTRTVSLFGSIASHVVDDVANLLNALLRGIAGGQGEADVVAGLPIDVPIGRCDFDRSLMESEVHTGSRVQAGSLSKGLRGDQAPRGIDGCGDGREMPCGRGL
jgi:hypothetical protein